MNFSSNSSSVLSDPETSCYSSFDWPPLEKDHFIVSGSKEMAWRKYCGFLDFSLDEYVSIQRLLLKEQIKIITGFPLGQAILGGHEPESVDDYRHFTPLTRYTDYDSYFNPREPLDLNEKVIFWAESPGKNDQPVRIPFSLCRTRSLVDDMITALILSSAAARGDVRLEPMSRMLIKLRIESISKAVNIAISQRLECRTFMEDHRDPVSRYRVGNCRGFSEALIRGVDFIVAEPEIIAGLGDNLEYSTLKNYTSGIDPAVLYHFVKAWWINRIHRRPVLAKDLCQTRGIISCGKNISRYAEQIERVWGKRPLEVLEIPEGGLIAVQTWNKKGLTLLPYRNFYEFIPLAEIEKEAGDPLYQPSTLLMGELKKGEIYELVITNFHGGPFLRYRSGEWLKVEDLSDPETGINLPQFRVWDPQNKN